MRWVAMLALSACSAGASTYYVDCASGSDGAAGTSDRAAWKSVDRVSAITFAPADSILFRRGGRCAGMLWPKGSGEPGRPIRIGAYGEGPLPVLSAGKAEAALKLFDQQQWEIENLETTGGDPYGVWISATAGAPPLRHFVLRNVVAHDVTGVVKRKQSGVVVLAGALEDVVIDGVTAYGSSQWAGIYVSGATDDRRARNVVVRNSIVHDVDGDGIVLFRTENGRIERSAAWRTGLQERETIGTPNGIWTWTCRNCVVENTEGFWIDSPGVDGGVYDIDWGNDDNVVQHNYAHDAQGYCAAIFGAGKRATTNSVVRENVCVNNGRSPKLARRQGDLYTSTWDGGSLDGIRIERNTVVWNPPIDAPALQMAGTEFSGSRENVVARNVIYSAVANMVRSGGPVKFERNVYWRPGGAPGRWSFSGREYSGIEEWTQLAPTDVFVDPGLQALFPKVESGRAPAGLARPGKWTLLLLAGKADADARSLLVFVQAALAQYGGRGLEAGVVADGGPNLRYDWNFADVRALGSAGAGNSTVLMLVAPSGEVVRRWNGFSAPADLGLALKRYLGAAPGNAPLEIEGHLP